MQLGGGSLEASLHDYRIEASQFVEREVVHIVELFYRDCAYFVISPSRVEG